MKKYSLVLILMLGVLGLQAQETKITDAHVSNFRSWGLGASIGYTYLNGDYRTFNPDTDPSLMFGWGLTITGHKYLSSVLGVRAQGMIGGYNGVIGGNTVVRANHLDGNVQAILNLSALATKGKLYDRKWSILAYAGMGLSSSTVTRYATSDREIEIGSAGDPRLNEFYLPIGMEAKYRMTKALDLDMGLQVKFYTSDIMDAFSSGQANDQIFYPYAGVTYNFKNKKDENKASVIYENPLDDTYAAVEEVKKNYDKLTTDDDGDGVNNMMDKDNTTPAGVAVNGDGTPVDADGDGIPDYMDEDPFTAKGAEVDEKGNAIDSDNDGVADYMDAEPNTPEGQMVNFKGMTIKVSGSGSAGAMAPSIFFAYNSDKITDGSLQSMAAIARALKADENLKVTIVGNTDKVGSEEYNKNLGMRRAQAVVKKLSSAFGIDESRMTAESAGKSKLLAEDEAASVNRRADIIFE